MTPLMQQYWDIKNAHKDKILLFRMGDFYEMFHDDAVVAAAILNIILTSRNKKAADETRMCGVPYHSIAGPISKLLASGHKVAICDQIEDPAVAKGIVKRAVTRILSPGMVYDPSTLDQLQANYICAFDDDSLSFLEPTTGEAFWYATSDVASRHRLMILLAATEVVLSSQQRAEWERPSEHWNVHLTVHEMTATLTAELPVSAQRLLSYATSMQGSEIAQSILPFKKRHLRSRMALSATSIRHLELFATYKGDRAGSLFHSIDRTKTSGGARRLKSWLQFPLTDLTEIQARLEQVQFWFEQPKPLQEMRSSLAQMGDIERRLGKIANPGCNARDLIALAQSLRIGLIISPLCPPSSIPLSDLKLCEDLVVKLESQVVDDPPISVRQGGLIRAGVNSDLDELIQLTEHSQGLLQELEDREKKATGISSLKVRYNNVFGYYIEITKIHSEKAPSHYRRKQTLTNAERYTTPELAELENKVLSAHTKRSDLEFELFSQLRRLTLAKTIDLLQLAQTWSDLDVVSGLAWLAIEQNYRRPNFGDDLRLVSARHPVIEQQVKLPFVPNTIHLDHSHCLLLTGPNMAGKSTLMRQVAIIGLMAQIGSFVPAESAVLPIFDAIFTRIGSSDFLAEGLSTFMVEMKETAEIMQKATSRSLVILDEIGRGTSTYDGLSLAQAILEHLVKHKKPMTFFATHYHELSHLAAQYPQVHNAHMSIREQGGEITFLHTLVTGPANKSYGIHVARLAGLPAAVTLRAKNLLDKLEDSGGTINSSQMVLMPKEDVAASVPEDIEILLQQIRQASLQKMTPLEALNQIAQWQQNLS